MKINPIYLKDFYKVGHVDQYPPGTELVFSNFTPRKSRMPGVDHSVWFGMRYFLKEYLEESFKHFFDMPLGSNGRRYTSFMQETLGCGLGKTFPHIEKLHNLGYLPIAIYALPEGSVVPCGVPAMVIYNTHPEFYWLPGALETLLSCTLWGPCTSATIARQYRLLLDDYADKTSDIPEFVDYQAHDFSFRGMFGVEAACLSGMAHLQYFKGTDTIPALMFNDAFYNKSLHIASVPATEHSVMCAGGKENELETFRRLINHTYPSGFLSVVSDSWNFWRVIGEYLPLLKEDIMRRYGKVVIRPDSGDPLEIICGTKRHSNRELPDKGLIESLWDIFGGTINAKGFKQLDPHIGAIYGDSITLHRARDICERLKNKGFASTNIVFGIGSYSYQYNTRDTLGWAMKATYCEINGDPTPIFKDPITDDGTKRSAKGILKVRKSAGVLFLDQQCSWDEFHQPDNELKLVYQDGGIIE